jgi:hypothetical protein
LNNSHYRNRYSAENAFGDLADRHLLNVKVTYYTISVLALRLQYYKASGKADDLAPLKKKLSMKKKKLTTKPE